MFNFHEAIDVVSRKFTLRVLKLNSRDVLPTVFLAAILVQKVFPPAIYLRAFAHHYDELFDVFFSRFFLEKNRRGASPTS